MTEIFKEIESEKKEIEESKQEPLVDTELARFKVDEDEDDDSVEESEDVAYDNWEEDY